MKKAEFLTMTQHEPKYIPALSLNALTPFYDAFFRLTMREELFKRRLITEAKIRSGQRVLDLGCGTGTLTIMVKKAHPDSVVIGLDGDPQILKIARRKAKEAHSPITFDEGMAYQLHYPDASFDRVLSSMVFHHLTTEDKERTLTEIYRVLKPAGEFHLADFGVPQGFYAKVVSVLMRRFERVDDNVNGRIPEMFVKAGFSVAKTSELLTVFGTLELLRGSKS
jgi:ubiquinone/menaquinone biosynthesis C-methylase UbiE